MWSGRWIRSLITFQEMIESLRRQVWFIVAFSLVCLAVGVFTVVLSKTAYTASAEVALELRRSTGFEQNPISERPIDETALRPEIESQIAILQSDSVARDVIKTLHLALDGEFGPNENISEASVLSNTLTSFMKRLEVRRVGSSYIIRVQFTSRDPHKSATIVNQIVRSYLHAQTEANYDVVRRSGEWMDRRVESMREQVTAAEEKAAQVRVGAGDSSRAQSELRDLEAYARAVRGVYESLVQKQLELRQKEAFPLTEVRVLTEALPPLEPSFPRTRLTLALSMFLGIGGSVVLAASFAIFDNKIRASSQIARITNTSAVFEFPAANQKSNSISGSAEETEAVTISNSAFQALARYLSFSARERGRCYKVAVISLSDDPKEGSAARLAEYLARNRRHTVLVDTSMTKMPSSYRHPASVLKSSAFGEVRNYLDPLTTFEEDLNTKHERLEFIIFDVPAWRQPEGYAVLNEAEMAVIFVRVGKTTISELESVCCYLQSIGVNVKCISLKRGFSRIGLFARRFLANTFRRFKE